MSAKPRASRAKATEFKATESKATESKPTESIAIFVEEVSGAPVAAPSVPKKKSTSSRKPPVIAAVTPDGIQGTLTPTVEQRPLIAHLPIHSTDIDNDMFAPTPTAACPNDTPNPFDPEDVFMSFTASSATKTQQTPVESRPTLPLHYSEKLMVRFQDANREQRLPDSTDVACFWDCHPFRGTPCVIPVGIDEGIWRVYGNFCSPQCAAAHLFQERLDSHVQWERYALLNRLFAAGPEGVRLAPSRHVLRLFGGTLDIADFRAIVAEGRLRVDVMTPPMISVIQVMDTKPIDFYDASMKNTFIPWEMDRMDRPGAQGLRLQRKKPVTEKEATLEYCMGITR